jgi:phosphoribosylformylglycinamidine (FGAM) synthase PurS component
MAKIVVDVMLKPEILDPQGVAVSPAQLAEVGKAAETLLANPVIETFTVRVEK